MDHIMRLATLNDLPEIERVFVSARAYLGSQGIDQWQNGYGPNSEMVETDIKKGEGYVLVVDKQIVGYTALVPGPDGSPDLSEGSWDPRDAAHDDYMAIHSVAIDGTVRGKGLGGKFLSDLIAKSRALGYTDIRIDTHPDNQIMQKVIRNAGFTYVGIMELDIPSGKRFAYQIVS